MGAANGDTPSGARLDSWKEISAYLKRDSRTLQRWEKKEGLPVHRHVHETQVSVYAYTTELDAWLAARSIAPASQTTPAAESPSEPMPKARPWRLTAAGIAAGIALLGLGVRQRDHRRAMPAPPPQSIRASAATSATPAPEPGTIQFHERDWVLLDAFENRTGEPLLDNALKNALERELSNSNFLFVAPRERVEDALRLMRKPPGTKMDVSLAREVCLRDDMRVLVTGRTEKLGSTYLFSVEVMDPVRNVPVAVHTEPAATQDQVWPAVRRLSNWVRESLGESMDRIERSSKKMEKVTTPSLRALQLFTEADEASKHSQWTVSAQLTRQALADDPNFASAHIYLAWALKNIGDSGWKAEAQRAMGLSAAVSERERLFIVASYYMLHGKPEQAVPVLEALVLIYPDHYFAYLNLTNAYESTGRTQQARSVIAQAADLRPNDYHINALATALLLPHDLDRGSHYAQRARMMMQLQPAGPLSFLDTMVLLSRFDELWMRGDVRGASAELDRLARLPQTRASAVARNNMAPRYIALGRFRAAEEWVAPDIPDLALTLAYNSGDEGKSREYLTALWSDERPFLDVRHALIALHLGITGWDRKLAATIDRQNPELRDGLRGVAALQEGRTAEAIPLLRHSFDEALRSDGFVFDFDTAEGLSLALEQSGNLQQAAEALEPLSNKIPYPLGAWDWLRNQARLAGLYRKMGRAGDSRKIEDQLRTLLAVADSEDPILQQLRGFRVLSQK